MDCKRTIHKSTSCSMPVDLFWPEQVNKLQSALALKVSVHPNLLQSPVSSLQPDLPLTPCGGCITSRALCGLRSPYVFPFPGIEHGSDTGYLLSAGG